MTFEEWWADNAHKALDTEEVRFQKDWYEKAFQAGRKSLKDELIGEYSGDYVEVHRDTLCEMVGEYDDF
jgi:hypothetical protein